MEQTENNTPTPTANDSRQIVADRCRSIMAQRGLKLADLASLCQLPPSNLSSMINGKRNPTLDTLDRLATALGIPTWQLLCTPGEEGTPEHGTTNQNQDQQQEQEQTADHQPDSPADNLPFDNNRATDADKAPQAAESPAGGRKFDLMTVDPTTGETRLYRLVNP